MLSHENKITRISKLKLETRALTTIVYAKCDLQREVSLNVHVKYTCDKRDLKQKKVHKETNNKW